jgi:hypothetical protein
MEVSYQLTPKDFVQVARQRREWKREASWFSLDTFWLLIWAVVLLGGVVAILAAGSNWRGSNLGFAILLFLAVLVAVPITRWVLTNSKARNQFLADASAQATISLKVSTDGLSFRGMSGDGTPSWSYARWRESKNQFVLFTAPETFLIVPKRAFTSDQRNEFREYLRRYIPKRS